MDGLTKTVDELKKEVDLVPLPHTSEDDDDDEGHPLQPSTQFKTQARSLSALASEKRPSTSALAIAPSVPPAPSAPTVSTPTPSMTSAEVFAEAVLSTPTSTTGGDQPQRDD